MANARLLMVDDDEMVRTVLAATLAQSGFEVTTAGSVPEALKHISAKSFDVLLSDLHMPNPGDGLTVASAMRHANPGALTLLLSAFPDLGIAADTIRMQVDEIMVKPMDATALADVIRDRLKTGAPRRAEVESVATILERSGDAIVKGWFEKVQDEPDLMTIPLSCEERSDHLPRMLKDVVKRLRSDEPMGTRAVKSSSATEHGLLRRKQNYTAEMIVAESRILQASIFDVLQTNLATINFSLLLHDVITIADEIEAQLGQAMKSYVSVWVDKPVPVEPGNPSDK